MLEVLNSCFDILLIINVKDDEIIEVTPQNIRMRKKELDPSLRKRMRRDTRNERLRFA